MSSNLRAIVAPSLLSCDFAKLGEEAKEILKKGADWLHCDVMDGHFVDNITIGPIIIKALRSYVGEDVFLDCHLMIENPGKWIEEFNKAGANQLTLHIEALDDDAPSVFKKIKDYGIRAGVSIKPQTEVDVILPLLDMKYKDNEPLIDMVLVMTVEPGFGGQAFMKEMMPKVKKLRELHPNLDIQVDGGLSPSTVDFATEAGANIIVAGSAIFKASDPGEVIKILRNSVESRLNK